ncbi:MAG: hypothetical protein OXD37_03640 [Acidimicrobiaceae bacterium]|nr:hypothetical protein [Acidimicrobiaceae bacterium]
MLAVLTVIWHQQRTTDKLRDRLSEVKERLARIEGCLRIGMPNDPDPKATAADAPQTPGTG